MPINMTSGAAVILSFLAMVASAPTRTQAAQETERLARVTARGELRICIWPAYYAISFRNPRNGELRGIDVDMAGALAADLKVRHSFVDSSFGSFMDDLEQDKCDVAMFAVGDTPARRQRVDMTAPHLRSGMYAITTNLVPNIASWDDIDRPGHVIAVQQGTVMEAFVQSTVKHATLNIVAAPATREAELLAGRADVFMTDYPYAQRMRFQHDWAVVITPPSPVAPTNYGYAVAKAQENWLRRINQFVATVKADGRLVGAAERHGLLPIVVTD